MSIVLQSTSGGSVTINEPTTASNFTQTLPAATGTVMVSGNMPAFSVWANANQSVTSGVLTLVNFGSKLFDTATCFNNTGSTVTLNGLSAPAYSFCPNVAGYYQATIAVNPNTTVTRLGVDIRKNGADIVYGNDVSGVSSAAALQGTGLIYLNGTGDYIQGYAVLTGSSPQIYGASATSNAAYTFFQAVLVRGS